MTDRTVPTEPTPEMLFAAMQAFFGEENYDGRCLGVSAAMDAEAHDCMRMAIAAALAASPAAPGAEVEPVAYRWHRRGFDGWHYLASLPHEPGAYFVQPLYLSPPSTDAIKAQARREALEEACAVVRKVDGTFPHKADVIAALHRLADKAPAPTSAQGGGDGE